MTKNRKLAIEIIPILGIVSFAGLYVYSSTLYPGGSQENLNTQGFDWMHNYWCNLMNEMAMNGKANPARPYSIFSMLILCLSLMFFFIRFAEAFTSSKVWKRLIAISGVLSMLFASLIFTQYHDLMTVLSSVFGLFVVVGIIKEIYHSELRAYKISGVICILLLGVNNYIYYTQHFLELLPLIQKITLTLVLAWIVGLNLELMKKRQVAARHKHRKT